MSSEFMDSLAAMKTEESYPKQTARFDVLTDKDDSAELTADERKELNGLTAMLEMELTRCRLHYKMNWPLMNRKVRDKLAGEVKAWKERLKGTKVMKDA